MTFSLVSAKSAANFSSVSRHLSNVDRVIPATLQAAEIVGTS